MKTKVGIVCSSLFELTPVLNSIRHQKISQKIRNNFYIGELGGTEIVAVVSGICKVNAALAAQTLIDEFSCEAIIVVGVAGGIDSTIALFDVVVSSEVFYWDIEDKNLVEFFPYLKRPVFEADPTLLSIANRLASNCSHVHFGKMITGETFMSEKLCGQEYNNALCVDMESASVAHVCFVKSSPFLAIRAISDFADSNSKEMFHNNRNHAAERAADFCVKILEAIDSLDQKV